MKKIAPFLILSLFTGFIMTITEGCKSGKEEPKHPPAFHVLELKGTKIPVFIQMVGQAEGIPTVEIRARVEGYLENWTFKEGSIVRKGQVLFTIEKDQYNNNVDYAVANVQNKEATWEYTKLNVTRLKPLVATNAISQNDYDVAVTQEKQAKAALESAQADLAQARLNLSYTTMTSPITGYIGAVEVRPGNLVGRGESTLLATVSAVDPIYVNFQMNETDFLQIMRWVIAHKQGASVSESLKENSALPVYLTLSDNKDYSQPGRIDFIGRNIDPSTGTIALRAVFFNKDGLIKPGSFSNVTLILGERENGIVIPQSTLQQIQDKYFVFLVDSLNKVTRVPVDLGQHIGNIVVVINGLKPGDRILLEGFQKIKEGMPITPRLVPDTLTLPKLPT
ncbi:MAG: efflux RND transporter periplasmic adaptor subunit [bacterium]